MASDDMLVATESFVTQEGVSYRKDVTRVRANDPSIKGMKHLFKPLDVSYPKVEAAVAEPGEARPAGRIRKAVKRVAKAAKAAAKEEPEPEPEPELEPEPEKPSGLTTASLKGE